MNSYYYDFHTHSCLSPCGDNDMTPNNMVNMALLAGCDIMAITDHNTCKNAPAVMKAGEEAGLLVIPGMELCTSEEAHIVCLFETLDGAMEFDRYIYENIPHIKNKSEIFGEQRICDDKDNIIGYEDNLLLVASSVGSYDIMSITERFGGVAYPAHIDRDSYSIYASLGAVPQDCGFTAAEITMGCSYENMLEKEPFLNDLKVFRSSDAHYLETLAGDKQIIHLPEKSIKAVIDRIRKGKIRE